MSGTNVASSNRIIGAYIFLNEKQRAKQLQDALIAAGYQCDPVNPFIVKKPLLMGPLHTQSPYVARILTMWLQMRCREKSSKKPRSTWA